ncbi:phosphoribosyl-ATP diphosphatase [Candidatus Paraluminiphilus aquimaris]|uniref:Phosphoribosyl-ATP pyrophosphatase n=1 Tax=Candidatus Paraluminiphilus aquimaris TaxID=2518994 RepID=A0ABY6Q6J6_9GAMM|nr:phosphoribosyl-ATP diphosphatase [Candidatus Paraluminiphilus aquimaris]UZP73876.1 phosphoribosyl-ATP diphosphatase [Candidatus Paraluminiphilus aquimaris]
MSEVLDALALVIAKRRAADPNESYVASLNAKGLNKILEKVGEEAVEVVIAAKDAELAEASNDRLINEVADLVFHTLVMLDRLGISHNEVLDALASRQGLSGLQEKASRNQ